jgi:tripartite-type tricarboxylate transporter receptor subunit TctC
MVRSIGVRLLVTYGLAAFGITAWAQAFPSSAQAFPSLAQVFPSAAQAFPILGKPIRIVVPYPAGGQAELYARQVASKLAEALAVPVLVELKPGASTAIGAADVQRSAPDGHHLLFTNGLTHVQNPHFRQRLAYDAKLFTPIFQWVDAGNVLTAHPSVPASNLQELIAYAKANPGKLSYASISPGSSSHLMAEILKLKTGIELTHVPYKGAADAGRDLWAGQVQLLFDGMQTATTAIKAQRVKPLAMAAAVRNPSMPTVPTAQEQGVSGLDLPGFIGFFGPADMPVVTVNRLNAELQKILELPEMAELIRSGGNLPAGGSAESFRMMLSEQYERWGEIIRHIGLKLD